MARSVNIEAERARRNEQGREMRAAFYAGTTVEQRGKQRETKAADWAAWFHSRMDETGSNDPNEFLPEAMARLEQMNADRVITAIREFKAAAKGSAQMSSDDRFKDPDPLNRCYDKHSDYIRNWD